MAANHAAVIKSNEALAPSAEIYTKTSGLPLAMAEPGRAMRVSSIRGKDEVKRFLTNLGFTQGAEVMLVSEMNGNVIVKVMDARVAISKAMATRILTD